MNRQKPTRVEPNSPRREADDPRLLDLARQVDPPGQEVTDDELIDPGANLGTKRPPARENGLLDSEEERKRSRRH